MPGTTIVPKTPTRRSTRFQPIVVSPSKGSRHADASRYSWGHTEPLHSRSIIPGIDLLSDDLAEWDEMEEEEKDGLQTRFYDVLRVRKLPASKLSKSKGKQKADASEFTDYRVGDTVLVMSSSKKPSIAVIVDMWETDLEGPEDTEKTRVRVHWFDRPSELASIRAKREHREDEIYYSLSNSTILFPSSIISHCTVKKGTSHAGPVSPSKKRSKYVVEEESNLMDASPSQEFQCLLAVDSRRGLFYRFDWERLRKRALNARMSMSDDAWGDATAWNVEADTEGKASSSVESEGSNSDSFQPDEHEGSGDENSDFEDEGSQSGDDDSGEDGKSDLKAHYKNRKRKHPAFSTPRKARRRAIAHPTPHSKAAISTRGLVIPVSPSKRKNAFSVRMQDTYKAVDDALHNLPDDPWLRAMHVLHVGSRPVTLPCRNDEYEHIFRSVGDLLEDGSGGCVYISGVPGTGKTATVHAVVRELKRMAENNEINPFTYCEINGLRLPEPSAAYTLLWEAISGHDVSKEGHLKMSAKESLKSLTRHFSGGGGRARGPSGHACVVLMDELDQVVTSKQDIVYNFFNWPTLVNSKLVVIAVANTHDLPERAMSGRVRSRLGMDRINFHPYTSKQLEEIVKARLMTASNSLSLDKVIDVVTSDGIRLAASRIAGISGDARRILDICRRAVEMARYSGKAARIKDIQDVMKDMQNSPTVAYIKECSLHERMMLVSLIKCMKREGVEEIKLNEVQYQHLVYMNILVPDDGPKRKPTPHELSMVLESLVASRAILIEDDANAMRKAEGERKVVLNLEQGEVERVLSEFGDSWKKALGFVE